MKNKTSPENLQYKKADTTAFDMECVWPLPKGPRGGCISLGEVALT